MKDPSLRRRRAMDALREHIQQPKAVEYYLTRDLPSVRYFTGFTGSNATLLMSDDAPVLITDSRYRDQAQAETDGVSVHIDRDSMAPVIALAPSSVVVDPTLPIADVDRLRDAGITALASGTALREVRAVKDADEIEQVERACSITARALEALHEVVAVGDSEIQIARRLEGLFADLGAEDRAFATIVASGPNAAIPHHRPTDRALQPGDLMIVDCGALVGGYHADMTRTFVVSQDPEPWQRQIHQVVLSAQQAALAAVRPGVSGSDIDHAARSVIADAGFADAFLHGTGHGVGLQIHEPPMLVPTSTDTLTADSPMTIEPGLYLPGRGGVRVEDTIVVGSPSRVLTDAPRDLIVVG
ncbi:MAG: M24 family metallopeptidase [Candidatus Nanopelagicales bacterium]